MIVNETTFHQKAENKKLYKSFTGHHTAFKKEKNPNPQISYKMLPRQ